MAINPNLIGAGAVAIWATAAAVTAIAGRHVPPLLLMSATSLGVFAVALVFWLARGDKISEKFRLPVKTWVFGIYGFGLYGSLYFLSFKFAPAFEASLLNYLWPALLIVFSAMASTCLPAKSALLGCAMSFIGSYFILTDGSGFNISREYWAGYVFAILAALVWSSYSALTKSVLFAADRIAVFLLATGLVTLLLHWQFEETAWPVGLAEWGAWLALILVDGLAPMLWDYSMKRGQVKLIASLAYSLPLLSSLILLAAGLVNYHARILIGGALIITGCLVINLPMLVSSGQRKSARCS